VKLVVGHSTKARNFGVKQLVGSSASNPTKQFWGSKQLVAGSSAISRQI
jgi:hypothetical protein